MKATFDDDTTLIGNGNEEKKTKGWQKVAIGGVTGIVLGSVPTLLMGRNTSENNELPAGESNGNATTSGAGKPSWAVGDIGIATSVNDDMNFGEAFAAARAEVGPGGAFEWHGNVYGTYNADEWNNMSAQDKAQFNDHFSWNHGQTASHHSTTSYAHNHSSTESELEVVSADSSTGHSHTAQHNTPGNNPEPMEVVAFDSEVEVIGVMQDEESGSIVAGLSVYGQEAIIVDFDGDLTFDVLATDINHNGTLEEHEVVDLDGMGITMDTVTGLMNPTGDILTSSDNLDILPDTFEV